MSSNVAVTFGRDVAEPEPFEHLVPHRRSRLM
jgi:hypothetical protein